MVPPASGAADSVPSFEAMAKVPAFRHRVGGREKHGKAAATKATATATAKAKATAKATTIREKVKSRMELGSTKSIWLLVVFLVLLNCGAARGANLHPDDSDAHETLVAEQTDGQRTPPVVAGASTVGATAAVGAEQTQTKAVHAAAEASTESAAVGAAQNPFASIPVVLFQQDTNFSIGPNGRIESDGHLLPIVPMRLSASWTVTTMVNVPMTHQPIVAGATGNTGDVSGLGDIQPTFFFIPRLSSGVTWGIGPVLNLPTATNAQLATGKFSIGPAMVLLWQSGNWTVGTVTNYLRSVGGPSSRNVVNQVNPSYFASYNLRRGWYVTTNAGLTGDWTQPTGNQWKVPFGGGAGRVMKMGSQLVNFTAVAHVNAVHNSYTERWGLLLQFGLLYPRKPKG